MSNFEKARQLMEEFKGDRYAFGFGVLDQTGAMVSELGKQVATVCTAYPGSDELLTRVKANLEAAGLTVMDCLEGVRPNAPRQDLARLADEIRELDPKAIVVIGGGSTIDAGKAAEVLRTLGGDIEEYFGTGKVTEALTKRGKTLNPVVAIQTAASSGAHLTKYSNITDLETGQKKLIVDEAIVPPRAIFDYSVTMSMPRSLTADGALDGIAHCVEVFYGAVGQDNYKRIEEVAGEGVRLIVNHLERVMKDPENREGRQALGLGTDLGGYSIMLGGTSGGHLTSFSLVDILSHGRACAIMNPYYTVFFAPAIKEPLRVVGNIYKEAGLTTAHIDRLSGRDLGMAVAEAMINLSQRIGFPTTLGEVKEFTEAHIERALTAAKNPQLKMKLENMPVPLTAEMVDDYMGPILEAARDGDLSLIKNVP